MDDREREIRARLEAAASGAHGWLEVVPLVCADLRYLLAALDAAREAHAAAVAALTERESALARIDELFARTEEVRTGLQTLREEYTLALERRVQTMRERADEGCKAGGE